MLTTRLRMWIIYFLIAVAVIAGCIGVAAKFETAEMKLQMTKQDNTIAEKGREITKLKEENMQQQLALTKIEASREADDTILASLASDIAGLRVQRAAIDDKITILEKSNEQVRDLLDTRLPPDGCLLDDSCEGRNPTAAGSGDPETK